MRIFLSVLVLFCLIASAGQTAEKTGAGEDLSLIAQSKKNLSSVVAEDSFFSEQPAVLLPSCQGKRLAEVVLKRIDAFYVENKQRSIIDKRKQMLLMRDLNAFENFDLKQFEPKDNYALADRVIDVKINQGVKEENLLVCKSLGKYSIFLLVYPKDNFYKVEIVNFPETMGKTELVADYI